MCQVFSLPENPQWTPVWRGGGHRTYFVDGGNNEGGDTAQQVRSCQIYTNVGGGGTPHILCRWEEQLGWGHRKTLKENMYH